MGGELSTHSGVTNLAVRERVKQSRQRELLIVRDAKSGVYDCIVLTSNAGSQRL